LRVAVTALIAAEAAAMRGRISRANSQHWSRERHAGIVERILKYLPHNKRTHRAKD
jgi:hypothetical protein